VSGHAHLPRASPPAPPTRRRRGRGRGHDRQRSWSAPGRGGRARCCATGPTRAACWCCAGRATTAVTATSPPQAWLARSRRARRRAAPGSRTAATPPGPAHPRRSGAAVTWLTSDADPPPDPSHSTGSIWSSTPCSAPASPARSRARRRLGRGDVAASGLPVWRSTYRAASTPTAPRPPGRSSAPSGRCSSRAPCRPRCWHRRGARSGHRRGRRHRHPERDHRARTPTPRRGRAWLAPHARHDAPTTPTSTAPGRCWSSAARAATPAHRS
jgi:hypothetical protein